MNNKPPRGRLFRWLVIGAVVGALNGLVDGTLLGLLLGGFGDGGEILFWASLLTPVGAGVGLLVAWLGWLLLPRLVLPPPDDQDGAPGTSPPP